MTTTIELTKDDADELLCCDGGGIDLENGETYRLIEALDETISERRWATIRRNIYERMSDGTFWALDHEYSHNEMREQWSYVKPQLRAAVGAERTVTVWELA